MDYAKESLKMHEQWKGKIEVVATAPVATKEDLSLAYTPGVAQPCLEINKDVNRSYDLTRRPSFTDAANPELGNALYEKFLAICEELGYPPQHGEFGADMQVESVNDGPVTLILDTEQLMNEPRRK